MDASHWTIPPRPLFPISARFQPRVFPEPANVSLDLPAPRACLLELGVLHLRPVLDCPFVCGAHAGPPSRSQKRHPQSSYPGASSLQLLARAPAGAPALLLPGGGADLFFPSHHPRQLHPPWGRESDFRFDFRSDAETNSSLTASRAAWRLAMSTTPDEFEKIHRALTTSLLAQMDDPLKISAAVRCPAESLTRPLDTEAPNVMAFVPHE
jgi:hypothetical protein